MRLVNAVIVLLMVAGVAYANQFSAAEKAGDLTVMVTIENDPLKVGDNRVYINLVDGKGQAVTDADIAVYYFMPSMPAMNYEVAASAESGTYGAVIKPTMPGVWDADITVKRTDGDEQKITLSLNAK